MDSRYRYYRWTFFFFFWSRVSLLPGRAAAIEIDRLPIVYVFISLFPIRFECPFIIICTLTCIALIVSDFHKVKSNHFWMSGNSCLFLSPILIRKWSGYAAFFVCFFQRENICIKYCKLICCRTSSFTQYGELYFVQRSDFLQNSSCFLMIRCIARYL